MSPSAFRVRRATVDDLPDLRALWEAMHLPAADLERRLTEFQIAESEDGTLLGAVGLEILDRQGNCHSEAFNDFGLADFLREQLWQRIQSLATNHGLARLWTRETAPFWKQNGFTPADPDALKRLPTAWDPSQPDWLTSRLRDEVALEQSLEHEFSRFKEDEKKQREKASRRARTLKLFATLLAVALAILVLVISFVLIRNRSFLHGR
jgi:N-acetylglutamate synthase-like GNAT family acetyltransferase